MTTTRGIGRWTVRAWLAVFAIGCALAGANAHAQDAPWPTRPLRMVVGFAPGSGADVVARALAGKLGERLGQSVVVDNRPGAGGILSAEITASATPDGLTILFVTGALTTAAAINRNLKLDVLRDLAPIAAVGRSQVALLVRTGLPARSFAELAALARSAPGKLTYGSSGIGGSTHFFTEQLCELAGIRMTHVPYKGTGPASVALQAGEIDVLMSPLSVAPLDVASGRARALAVTGARRATRLPEVPTFAEAGLAQFDASIFSGFVTAAKVPTEILERLNREVNAVLKDPEVVRRLATDGDMNIAGGTRAEFAREIADSLAEMKRIAQSAGIQAD